MKKLTSFDLDADTILTRLKNEIKTTIVVPSENAETPSNNCMKLSVASGLFTGPYFSNHSSNVLDK